MKAGGGRVTKKEILSTEAISLYNSKNIQISNLRRYMINHINGSDLEEYMMKRKGWTKAEMREIEWEGVEAMLRGARSQQRANLIKLLHNWQNTGRQKGKFRDARIKINSDDPLTPTEEETHCHKCPDGCNEEETDLHYLNCVALHAKRRRKVCIEKVLRRLKSLRTYEGITSTIGMILNRISNREELIFDWEELQSDGDMAMTIAIEGQIRIGWNCLCQGFYHKEWARIQLRYYQRMGKNTRALNIRRWKKMFSTILTEYSIDCWKLRNESIHGNEKDESRKKRKMALGQQIRGLYKNKEELSGKTRRRVFNLPLKKRLGMGIQSSKLWINLAEKVLRIHRGKRTNNTLHHWLQP